MVKKSSNSKSTKSNSNPEVRLFRLNNGEDIISECEDLDNAFLFKNPCKVLYVSTNKPGMLSVSFMQWVFSKLCTNQTFEINKRDVLFNVIPNESMIEHYWDSSEHFVNSYEKTKVDFSKEDDEMFTEESEEALDLLREFLNRQSKSDKGNLH